MSAINKVLRDIRLALRTVGINLLLLAGLIAVTVTLLSLLNSYPGASRLQLLVNTFHLITMDRVLDGSQGTLPWILTLLLPILTFLILGEGFLRFISIYLNRSEHKKEWAELIAMTMKNHLILCGVGELGKEVFRRMKAGNPKLQAVLVELKPYVLAELGQAGEEVIHLQADMTDLETLKRANCSTAGVIIVSSGDDVVNLETAFKIHSLNPTAQIWVRLHRLEMAKLLELSKKPNFHFFCPYQQAADTLVNELHAQTREFP